MNEKLKTVLLGALEAFGLGALAGLAVVWPNPTDVIFSLEGLKIAGTTAAQFGVIYLFAFLRQNRNLSSTKEESQ